MFTCNQNEKKNNWNRFKTCQLSLYTTKRRNLFPPPSLSTVSLMKAAIFLSFASLSSASYWLEADFSSKKRVTMQNRGKSAQWDLGGRTRSRTGSIADKLNKVENVNEAFAINWKYYDITSSRCCLLSPTSSQRQIIWSNFCSVESSRRSAFMGHGKSIICHLRCINTIWNNA